MVQKLHRSSQISVGLGLAFVLAQFGLLGCAQEEAPPPPVFGRPKGGEGGETSASGGRGGEGGTGSTNCSEKKTGCDCDEVGSTAACKVYETFDDYVTCTTGFLTCGDDGTWGQCIGERTTQPTASEAGGN